MLGFHQGFAAFCVIFLVCDYPMGTNIKFSDHYACAGWMFVDNRSQLALCAYIHQAFLVWSQFPDTSVRSDSDWDQAGSGDCGLRRRMPCSEMDNRHSRASHKGSIGRIICIMPSEIDISESGHPGSSHGENDFPLATLGNCDPMRSASKRKCLETMAKGQNFILLKKQLSFLIAQTGR